MDLVATVVARIVWMAAEPAGSPSTGLVPTLLTGGGFAFLGIVMAGLFMWNKNKADSASTVAQGAATWAEGMSKELGAYKSWSDRQRVANRQHTEWDDELIDTLECLIRKCEEHEIIEPGSIKIDRPPSLDIPFAEGSTDPMLPKAKKR